MRTLEIRRHSLTKQGDGRDSGSTLSPDGVHLARQIGEHIGPFAYVIASTIPRTMETALAMGFAVDELVEMADKATWQEATAEIDHKSLRRDGDLYLRYLERFTSGGPVARLGRYQVEVWESALRHVEDGEAALVGVDPLRWTPQHLGC